MQRSSRNLPSLGPCAFIEATCQKSVQVDLLRLFQHVEKKSRSIEDGYRREESGEAKQYSLLAGTCQLLPPCDLDSAFSFSIRSTLGVGIRWMIKPQL